MSKQNNHPTHPAQTRYPESSVAAKMPDVRPDQPTDQPTLSLPTRLPVPLPALLPDEDVPAQSISLHALGRNWIIKRPASLEDLWEQMSASPAVLEPAWDELEGSDDKGGRKGRNVQSGRQNLARNLYQAFEQDDRIPYWTELWPAGIALAEWLSDKREQIKGKPCLDLGCGLGFSALAAAWLGAKVLAMDYEPQALYYAALNGRLMTKNAACPDKKLEPTLFPAGLPTWVVADWRQPCFKPGNLEIIWAGDIMYEHRFITPVANFLEHTLAPQGIVWIAEPGRNIYPEFAKTMQNRGWQAFIAGRKPARLPETSAPQVNVQIWQLQRKG